MTVPFASGLATRTTSCTEREPPAASDPIDQVTIPAKSDPPPVADTNVVLAGTVSERTTPVAPEFPRSEERRVGKEGRPATTGSGASIAVTTRTGAEGTVVVMAVPLTGSVSTESML